MKPSNLLFFMTTALLASCAATPEVILPQAPATRSEFVKAVTVTTADTPASIAQRFGGTILAWPTDCSQAPCTALLGLEQVPAQQLQAQGMGNIERNRGVFGGGGSMTAVMGGSRGMWAGGSFPTWAGGSRGMWAGGQYSLLPENTAIWQKVGLQRAQTMAPKLGAGVVVAVIDSGIDITHPAFTNALTPSSTWKDFYDNDALPAEEGGVQDLAYGHGTNVAGIVLQVAPLAKILPVRVLGPDGAGDVAQVAQAITYAANQGAQIINLSLGSADNSRIVEDALKRVVARGVIVVSSAGNESRDRITYPAQLAENAGAMNTYTLSVGSVGLQDLKSSFSNYANTLELVAPGENVYAPYPNGSMASWSGTSMAAPMASGTLALALGQTLTVKREELTKKLAESAFDVYNNGANKEYKDKLGVKGRLDMVEFLKNTVRQ